LKKTALVILNWNGRKFLKKFLPNVIKFSQEDAEIIVADNASSDDSIALLKAEFPEVRIIENKSNGGFATGYNEALKQVEAEYYILLNSDIEVTENWIKPVIEMMDKDSKIAVCQPKIRSYHEPEKFEYAGAAGGFIDKYGYPFCRGRVFQVLEEDKGQYDDAIEIFWATGAAFFVRAELYHKLGGLDDDFFAHMEEIDLCWRFKNHGYKIMYCPDSIVFHVGGGTLPKSSSRKTYLNFRNNFFLMYKNLPKQRIFKTILARLILDAVAAMKFLMQGGVKDLWAVTRAHLSFYKNFRTLQKKRRVIEQNNVSCMYFSNIAFDHFLHRKKYFSELDFDKFSK
jgi:GT2 family glycosyltransferase